MALTDTQVKITRFASGLGFIQGLTWTILSLICIILYFSSTEITSEPESYMESVKDAIYELFILTSENAYDGILTNSVFDGFMWIHFIINMMWVAVSGSVWRRNTSKTLMQWSFVTFGVAFWDFFTFVFLGSDYGKCMDFANGFKDYGTIAIQIGATCANTILPVFVIAAKGFTLWCFNIVIGVFMYKMGRDLKKEGN